MPPSDTTIATTSARPAENTKFTAVNTTTASNHRNPFTSRIRRGARRVSLCSSSSGARSARSQSRTGLSRW